MYIESILANYGFETRGHGIWWGIGSLVWGYTLTLTREGQGYRIVYHRWSYNCDGDAVVEEKREFTALPHEALTFAFTNLPLRSR